jgi:2-iminobutanoate/2-iminopropanoate deaminase
MEAITSAAAPVYGPYSSGLKAGEWVFLAGQVGEGATIEEQTEDAFKRIEALLGEAGGTVGDIVSCLVHLADLSLAQRFNAAYERHLAEPRPVRTTVGAALLGNALVEITAVARIRH